MKFKVSNMINNRSGNEVVNQFIINYGDNVIYFQSYGSIVAQIENGSITLDENTYDYSQTTLKYLYQFLNIHGGKKELLQRIESGEYSLSNLN